MIDNGETERERIKSVKRAFNIVESIQERDGATLMELATEVDTAKSTIHRHLSTLQEQGYIVKEDNQYYIGLRFLNPAIYARNRRSEYQLIKPKIDQIAEETGERAQFITEEHGRGIHVFSSVGERGIQTESRVGKLVYLHATSAGKNILAHLPQERVMDILDRHGLPQLTENTITSRDTFLNELETVRERGYAFNLAERRENMQAVGVPVRDPNGEILGGISITGPRRRMESDYSDIPDTLLDITEEITLRLTYPQY